MAASIPIDDRMQPPTMAGRAVAWLRLFAIEMRRTPALYAGLMIAAITAWSMWTTLPSGVVRWDEVSHSAGTAMIPVSTIAAGIGAYVARRDERLHLDDQLAQTAFGQARRDMLSLLATLVWCLVAYLVPVGVFFAYVATKATWAGPQWGYVTITAATIVLGVAGGWFTGAVFRNRFSMLVAVGAALAVHGFYPLSGRLRTEEVTGPDGGIYFDTTDGWYKNLFPYEVLDYYDVPSVIAWGAAWLLGIGTILLCVAWWWRHRSLAAIVGLSVAALVVGPAAAELVDQEPANWLARSEASYVDPTCEARLEGAIKVCVHPANEALLDDIADVIEPLIAPIAGIPGVPTTFVEQQPSAANPGVVMFYAYDEADLEFHVISSVLRELMNNPDAAMPDMTGSAQYVVLAWLLQEAGISPDEAATSHYLPPLPLLQGYEEALAAGITDPAEINRYFESNRNQVDFDAFRAEVASAVDRFAAMPDEERRAWLEANWDALVTNELTLEDLP